MSELDYRAIFKALPGRYLVLTPDSSFRIVEVSDAYAAATKTRRSEILGRKLFDVFPENPNDPVATATRSLRNSLERVVRTRKPDTMPQQRYDIPRPEGEGGGFEERHWLPINSPVFDETGKMTGIIHQVDPVDDPRLIRGSESVEKALENVRLRFENITRATDLGVWYCDLPFDELTWNERTKLHFWIDPSARVTIEEFYARIHPDDREPTRLAIERSIAERTTYDIEYRTVRPGHPNDVKIIRAVGWTDYDENNAPIRFDGITLDVTEQRHQERERFAEAEKNAMLLQHLPNPFFSVTSDWVLNYLNPAAEKVLGLKANEVVGMLLWDVFPGLEKSEFGEIYRRVMRERTQATIESYYAPFDRWYEATAFALDVGIAIWFFDVTDRRANQVRVKTEKEKFEAIFYGSASPMVFFRGTDFVYEIFNSKYAELIPKREIAGKPLLQALPELADTTFPQLLKRTFETGVPTITHEEVAPLRNALTGELEDRFFDSAISRVHDGTGEPYGVFVQVTESTERVASRRKIEQALAVRDNFLSIASHELKTPIATMKLQNQIVQRSIMKQASATIPAETVIKLVKQTNHGIDRMNRLVEDMLSIARIHEGKLDLIIEKTDLKSFVRGVVEQFADELASAEITPTVDESGDEMVVAIDRFRVEQIMANLLTNAIRYAPKAPFHVSFSEGTASYFVRFQDSGVGIAPQDQARIFERFERVDSVNNVRGLGLGLYISRQIARAHGGTLQIETNDCPGACFILELPRLN